MVTFMMDVLSTSDMAVMKLMAPMTSDDVGGVDHDGTDDDVDDCSENMPLSVC